MTTISGDAGGVKEDLKLNATLPLLQLSSIPNEELLQEEMQPITDLSVPSAM